MLWRIKYFIYSVAVIIIVSTSSCSNFGASTNVVTAESTVTPTAVVEKIPTIDPLPTDARPSPIPPPTISTQCVDASAVTQQPELSGVVALGENSRPADLSALGFFLLDVKTRNVVKTVDEGVYEQISPDSKYLVYRYRSYDQEYYHLRVLNSNGEIINDFPPTIEGRAQSFFNWQNATQLRTLQQDKDWKLSVQLLNPFTQEHTLLRTDWNGVYAPKDPFADKLVEWKFDERVTEIFYVYGANILYDPSLTRVLYPKDNGVVSLTDVENETELASAQFEDWGRLPSWSPDGQYLTIVNHEGSTDEFYLISRDGNEFQKITDFSNEFELAYIPEYSWSPDGKQIAFWLNTESTQRELGTQAELAVLDIATKRVTRLCIQGISVPAIEPWTMNHPEPVWSPDGKYIMITQWDDPLNPQNYFVLIVDSLTGAVTRISENTAPIGWMVSEP